LKSLYRVVLVAALYACIRAGDERVASDSSTWVKPRAPAGNEPDSLSRFAKTSSWTVNIRGIGPLQAGMSPSQAAAVMGVSPAIGDGTWSDCDYVGFGDMPEGVYFM